METTLSSGNLQSFLRLLDEKRMTHERFTTILGNGILADVLDPNADLGNRDAVRIALKLGAFMPDIFRLVVDYGKSLEQMIAAGHYNWKNDNITTKRFPIEGEGVVEFEARYFNFDHNISSENAVEEIEQADKDNPWTPAKIEHTLALGASFPEEQRKFPIIGLGSVAKVNGYRRVPDLRRSGSDRDLDLYWWGSGWYSGGRFLAVRKVSAP